MSKKFVSVLLAIVFVLSMAAIVSADEQAWLTVRDESDYVNKSIDELYEEAKQELAAGHQLVVYSETGSTAKSVDKFLNDYPEFQDLKPECTKLKTNAIAEKIAQEYIGNPYCDIVITSDGSGAIYEEWYKKGYVLAYYPASIESDLNQEYTPYGLPITLEADIWYYSSSFIFWCFFTC